MKKRCFRLFAGVLALAVMMTYTVIWNPSQAKMTKSKDVKKVEVTNVQGKNITLGKGKKLKVSCLCSQLSFIFGHPSPSTSMYFALFPYYFPCEESIREKVFFRLNRSLLLYPKVLLNFSWLPL